MGGLGLQATFTWASTMISSGNTASWTILLTSNMVATGGANVAGIIYELLTSSVHGIALDLPLIDATTFDSAATALLSMGLSWVVKDKGDARQLMSDILKNVQGALVISNGLIGLRLLSGGNSVLTLQADDVLGLKVRPGSWYEVPQHATIKYADVNRKFHDTVLSLPGAGDFGNDEKTLEIALPMVTDAGVARLIGSRLRTLEALPKNPDTVICGRNAFLLQFGDVFVINDPPQGYDSTLPLIAIAIREHGMGDELIEIDVVPDIFGTLPQSSQAVGGGGGGGGGLPGPLLGIGAGAGGIALGLCARWFKGNSHCSPAAPIRTPKRSRSTLPRKIPPSITTKSMLTRRTTRAAQCWIRISPALRWTARPTSTSCRAATISTGFSSLSRRLAGLPTGMLVLVSGSLYAAKELVFLGGTSWWLQGIFGPLSDTAVAAPSGGDPIFIFGFSSRSTILRGQPAWVINSLLLVVQGHPVPDRGSRRHSSAALLSQITVIASRAARPLSRPTT